MVRATGHRLTSARTGDMVNPVVADMDGWRTARQGLEQVIQWVRARPLLENSLLAAVVAPFAGWSIYVIVDATRPPEALAPWLAVVLVLAVVVEPVALVFRRVAPMPSFVAVSAASLVQTVLPGAPPMLPSLVAFPLSLFAYCAYGQRRAPVFGLAVGAVGAVLITAQLVISGQIAQGEIRLIPVYLSLLAAVLTAWSLGLFRRVQLAYVAALEERAARAEAEREERARRAVLDERARIAREMHDVLAHSLAVIISQAQGGQYAARADPARATETLATIAEAGRQALADTRGLLGLLHADFPSTTADGWDPQPTLRELPDLLDRVRAAGLAVQYTELGSAFPLGPAAELALYRLVQEALTNTLKHAGPDAEAAVRFDWNDDGLTLTVSDTGRGSTPGNDGGRGLIGMRERLAIVGGSVTAGPGPEGGFVVHAWVPRRTMDEGRHA